MIKGPLVKVAVLLAAVLMVMSIAIAAFPDQVVVIGSAAGVVAVAVVAVLLLMLFRMRKARGQSRGSNSDFGSPHWGHTQSSGKSSNLTPVSFSSYT